MNNEEARKLGKDVEKWLHRADVSVAAKGRVRRAGDSAGLDNAEKYRLMQAQILIEEGMVGGGAA
jgi:hypothetical protein